LDISVSDNLGKVTGDGESPIWKPHFWNRALESRAPAFYKNADKPLKIKNIKNTNHPTETCRCLHPT
jgi:hypothetical protein